MKIAAVLFLLSSFGAGLAPDIWFVIVFRIVGGLGIGVASVIAPAYIALGRAVEVPPCVGGGYVQPCHSTSGGLMAPGGKLGMVLIADAGARRSQAAAKS